MRFPFSASSNPADLDRLAARVEKKLLEMKPSGPYLPKDLALAAIAMVFELEELEEALLSAKSDVDVEKNRRLAVEADARDVMRRVLARIDLALEEDDGQHELEHASLS